MLLYIDYTSSIKIQVAHAFQDILGAEYTPTLPYSIPYFSLLIEKWRELIDVYPEWHDLIQPGLGKLKVYEDELPKTPAYIAAMGMLDVYNL